MKYRTSAAFRTALEARLKVAQHDGVGLTRLRKRVVFERLLARLYAVAPDAWVLKGGFALELRLGAQARTTKDVDVDWAIGEGEAIELLLDVATMTLDDRFEFAVERSQVDDDLPGGGQRWTAAATLAGREFERVAIDIGFAVKPVLEPETIASSHLLDFADIAPVRIPAVAIEQHVAEKLHAYTRTHAAGVPSSRVKDLVDIVVIAHTITTDADRLTHAIREIFQRRGTHPVPQAVPPPPSDWSPGWRKLVANVPADADIRIGYATAAAFLDPIFEDELISGRWDPDLGEWVN
ncbi:MAG: nucleotidyl transferase AbiEii/AbiGii toxin family protein [Solirubrobacteraceae bacterium]